MSWDLNCGLPNRVGLSAHMRPWSEVQGELAGPRNKDGGLVPGHGTGRMIPPRWVSRLPSHQLPSIGTCHYEALGFGCAAEIPDVAILAGLDEKWFPVVLCHSVVESLRQPPHGGNYESGKIQ